MNQHVSLTFSLKYLGNFSKSASLSSKVRLMMSNEVPLLVSNLPLFFLCQSLIVVLCRFHMTLVRVTFDTI